VLADHKGTWRDRTELVQHDVCSGRNNGGMSLPQSTNLYKR
jgi:hypothetical protein